MAPGDVRGYPTGMCRLLAYLGPPIRLERVVTEPAHSLVVQSYAPREMTAGTINADGFGVAWYDPARRAAPFVYRNILPIWSDPNLPSIAAYAESGAVLANVRSATPGQALDFSNTQPFLRGAVALLHNGFVDRFRDTLYRPLRARLSEEATGGLMGHTDSEHLAAWIFQHLPPSAGEEGEGAALGPAFGEALRGLARVAPEATMSLNFILGDGRRLVASRAAQGMPAPSLYHAADHPEYPDAVLIASEPLDGAAAWRACPEGSLIAVDPDRSIRIEPAGL